MSQRFCFSFLAIAALFILPLAFASASAASSPLSVSTTSIQFGSVNVGGREQQQIKITNPNNTDVVISSVIVSGRYFAFSGISTPLSLRPEETATFTVTFAPQIAGSETGKITISGRGLPAATNISLAATGVTAQISVVPSSASFGGVPLGTSNSQTFTITNHRPYTVTVSSDTIGGNGFSVANLAKGETIVPGRSATFTVSFKPTASGTITTSESLSFTSSRSSTTTITIPLSGSGVAATSVLHANPSTLNFGNVIVGSSSSLQVKLSNEGNSRITITQSSLTGTGFSLTESLSGLTLLSGQSEEVEVVFRPKAKGSASGKIAISTGSAGASVSIAGAGVQASTHSVNLSWSASVSPHVVGYIVERGSSPGGPFQALDFAPITGTDYVDSTVANGQTYYYVILSVSSMGVESHPSSPVSATIPSS
jgi:P pilus assembly chaperone PapD